MDNNSAEQLTTPQNHLQLTLFLEMLCCDLLKRVNCTHTESSSLLLLQKDSQYNLVTAKDVMSTDAYVKLYVGNAEFGRTNVVSHSSAPVWNSSFEHPLLTLDTILILRVYDHNATVDDTLESSTYSPKLLDLEMGQVIFREDKLQSERLKGGKQISTLHYESSSYRLLRSFRTGDREVGKITYSICIQEVENIFRVFYPSRQIQEDRFFLQPLINKKKIQQQQQLQEIQQEKQLKEQKNSQRKLSIRSSVSSCDEKSLSTDSKNDKKALSIEDLYKHEDILFDLSLLNNYVNSKDLRNLLEMNVNTSSNSNSSSHGEETEGETKSSNNNASSTHYSDHEPKYVKRPYSGLCRSTYIPYSADVSASTTMPPIPPFTTDTGYPVRIDTERDSVVVLFSTVLQLWRALAALREISELNEKGPSSCRSSLSRTRSRAENDDDGVGADLQTASKDEDTVLIGQCSYTIDEPKHSSARGSARVTSRGRQSKSAGRQEGEGVLQISLKHKTLLFYDVQAGLDSVLPIPLQILTTSMKQGTPSSTSTSVNLDSLRGVLVGCDFQDPISYQLDLEVFDQSAPNVPASPFTKDAKNKAQRDDWRCKSHLHKDEALVFSNSTSRICVCVPDDYIHDILTARHSGLLLFHTIHIPTQTRIGPTTYSNSTKDVTSALFLSYAKLLSYYKQQGLGGAGENLSSNRSLRTAAHIPLSRSLLTGSSSATSNILTIDQKIGFEIQLTGGPDEVMTTFKTGERRPISSAHITVRVSLVSANGMKLGCETTTSASQTITNAVKEGFKYLHSQSKDDHDDGQYPCAHFKSNKFKLAGGLQLCEADFIRFEFSVDHARDHSGLDHHHSNLDHHFAFSLLPLHKVYHFNYESYALSLFPNPQLSVDANSNSTFLPLSLSQEGLSATPLLNHTSGESLGEFSISMKTVSVSLGDDDDFDPTGPVARVVKDVTVKTKVFYCSDYNTFWPAKAFSAQQNPSEKNISYEKCWVYPRADVLLIELGEWEGGKDIIVGAAEQDGRSLRNPGSPSSGDRSSPRSNTPPHAQTGSNLAREQILLQERLQQLQQDRSQQDQQSRPLLYCKEKSTKVYHRINFNKATGTSSSAVNSKSHVGIPWKQVTRTRVVTSAVLCIQLYIHRAVEPAAKSTKEHVNASQEAYESKGYEMEVFVVGCDAARLQTFLSVRREMALCRSRLMACLSLLELDMSQSVTNQSQEMTFVQTRMSDSTIETFKDTIQLIQTKLSDLFRLDVRSLSVTRRSSVDMSDLSRGRSVSTTVESMNMEITDIDTLEDMEDRLQNYLMLIRSLVEIAINHELTNIYQKKTNTSFDFNTLVIDEITKQEVKRILHMDSQRVADGDKSGKELKQLTEADISHMVEKSDYLLGKMEDHVKLLILYSLQLNVDQDTKDIISDDSIDIDNNGELIDKRLSSLCAMLRIVFQNYYRALVGVFGRLVPKNGGHDSFLKMDGIDGKLKLLQQIVKCDTKFSSIITSASKELGVRVEMVDALPHEKNLAPLRGNSKMYPDKNSFVSILIVLGIPEVVSTWVAGELAIHMRSWIDKTLRWWKAASTSASAVTSEKITKVEPKLSRPTVLLAMLSSSEKSQVQIPWKPFQEDRLPHYTTIPQDCYQAVYEYVQEIKKCETSTTMTHGNDSEDKGNRSDHFNLAALQFWTMLELRAHRSLLSAIHYLGDRYRGALEEKEWAWVSLHPTPIEEPIQEHTSSEQSDSHSRDFLTRAMHAAAVTIGISSNSSVESLNESSSANETAVEKDEGEGVGEQQVERQDDEQENILVKNVISWLASVANDCIRVGDEEFLKPPPELSSLFFADVTSQSEEDFFDNPLTQQDIVCDENLNISKLQAIYRSTCEYRDECESFFLDISMVALSQLSNFVFKWLGEDTVRTLRSRWEETAGNKEEMVIPDVMSSVQHAITSFIPILDSKCYTKLVSICADKVVILYINLLYQFSKLGRAISERLQAQISLDFEAITTTFRSTLEAFESESGKRSSIHTSPASGALLRRLRWINYADRLLRPIRSSDFFLCMQDLIKEAEKSPMDAEDIAVFIETVLSLREDRGYLRHVRGNVWDPATALDDPKDIENVDEEEEDTIEFYQSLIKEPIYKIWKIAEVAEHNKVVNTQSIIDTLKAELESRHVLAKALLREDFDKLPVHVFLTHSSCLFRHVYEYSKQGGDRRRSSLKILKENHEHNLLPSFVPSFFLSDETKQKQNLRTKIVLTVSNLKLHSLPSFSLLGKEIKVVKFECAGQEIGESPSNNELEPMWDSSFDLHVPKDYLFKEIAVGTSALVTAKVFFKRRLKKDMFIGSVSVSLEGLMVVEDTALNQSQTSFSCNLNISEAHPAVQKDVGKSSNPPKIGFSLVAKLE